MARPTLREGTTLRVEQLLAEQLAYYWARAQEYADLLPELSVEVQAEAPRKWLGALDAFRPTGDVLELACGPGTWTSRLLDHASTVTAIEATPEMLAIAAAHIADELVGFAQANLFARQPDRRYVAFVDDAYRTAEELIEGNESSTIRRHLKDGTAFRAVKVPHIPDGLRERLADLGWSFTVTNLVGPSFWGQGHKA